jgi:hypothetical protein
MRSFRAALLLALAGTVAVAGCAHQRPPVAPPPPDAGPPLVERLTYRVDRAELDAGASARLLRRVEDAWIVQDEPVVVELVGDRAIHAILPAGVRPIPWPALIAIDAIVPPRHAPAESGDLLLSLRPDWRARFAALVLDDTVAQLRRRLQRLGLTAARVHAEGDQLVVELPAMQPEARDSLFRMLATPLRVSFQLVSPASAPVEDARGHPVAYEPPITIAHEHWQVRGAVPRAESFWRSEDPVALRLFAAAVGAGVPPKQRLLTGRMLTGDRTAYRTFVVEREASVTSDDVVDIVARQRRDTRQLLLALRFSAGGAKRLYALTAGCVGCRLAIVVDDQVLKSVVIEGPLRGPEVIVGPLANNEVNQAAASLMDLGSLPVALRAGN